VLCATSVLILPRTRAAPRAGDLRAWDAAGDLQRNLASRFSLLTTAAFDLMDIITNAPYADT
jgi:hypothetical protein